MKPRLEIKFPLRRQFAFLFGRPYQGQTNEYLFNHARSGLVVALKALGLPEKSKVGVMAYNCHTVFNAIAQVGLIPVFIDVTDELLLDITDLNRKSEGLSALVVTNLFGIRNDIVSIRSSFPKLPIIEDCAHAYGQQEFNGDFVVFSIGQGKFPSIGDGGVLLINNIAYAETVERLFRTIPDYRLYESVCLFFRLLLKSVLYNPIVYSSITRSFKMKRRVSSGVGGIDLKRMNRGIRAIYEIERKSFRERMEERIKNAEYISGSVRAFSEGCSVLIGENAFMLVAHPSNRNELKEWFMADGIETDTHFSHCIDWAHDFGYIDGSCPNTEHLIDSLLMIPTYA